MTSVNSDLLNIFTGTNVEAFLAEKSETSQDEEKRFFTEMLADVEDPTIPFGLSSSSGNGTEFGIAHLKLSEALTDQLRTQAEQLQVSLTTLCHLAWAQVVSRASGRESVVFGTVLSGHSQAKDGNDSALKPLKNILPLCVNMNQISVEDSVHQIHTRLRTLFAHKFASLSMAQSCSSLPADTPLFSALLDYRHPQHDAEITTLRHKMAIANFEELPIYPLTLTIDEDNHALRLTAKVDSSITPMRICAYMEQALTSLADALQHTPQQPVRALTVIPPEERHLLLHTFNQTAVTYPTDRCLHQLFEDQVKNNGHKIAAQCAGDSLSYAELNTQANRLAHYLIQLGVKPDSLVGLCMNRSTALVVGMLGILKSGGAYVPLDPAYPRQRLINILQDSDPTCVLTDSAGRSALGAHKMRIIDIDEALSANLSDSDPDTAMLGLNPNNLAYVIYTSGSTGTPKGVMIEHRTVVNFAYALPDLFDIDSNSRVLQFSSCSFDNSIKELIMGLTTGARLFIPSEEIRTNDIALLDYISSNKITHSCMTPALFRSTKDLKKLENMQILVFCGEAPTLSLLRNAAQHTAIFNGYGPTEATIATTYWLYSKDFEGQSIPVGRPVANFRTYILNSQGEPVPLGAEGELYISGAGVARGYLNRPDLTAERFLSDPFCETPGMRMYRSGDRARYLPDGNIVYLGRADQQVKIRGYRIETGEIEACLANHPKVREAVVQPRSDESGTRLIAYVVADADASLARDLRTYLLSQLPVFMVPAAFVRLSTFPLTVNGKLDLRALPAPDNTAFASQLYEAPKGKLEEKLAAIWQDLLGVERVSRHDNFFELGGHSLLVVRLMAQLRQDGLDASVRSMFDSSSLATLAASLSRHQAFVIPPNLITTDSSKITPDMLPLIELSQTEINTIIAQVPGGIDNIQDIYGLAPLQHGILYHYMTAESGDTYLTTKRMHFTDRATLELYANALQHVVERHDVLRTAFIWKGLNEPAQVVWRNVPKIFSEMSFDDSDEEIIEHLCRTFSPEHFKLDLSQASLLRLIAAPTTHGGWVAVQLMHHIIGDNFTLEKLDDEVCTIVDRKMEHLMAPTPFRHVVAQTRLGVNSDEDKRFFSAMLAEIDEPTLPFGLSDIRGNKTDLNTADLRLSKLLNDQLRIQAKRLQVSLASLCHLAWAQVLAHSSGREPVVFGTVLFGRFQAAEGNDSAIGLLINTLPLRIDIDETPVTAAVRHTHARLSDLLSHEHASLALAQRCSGVPPNMPLFNALINYRHHQQDRQIATEFRGMTILSAESRTNYPLNLSIDDNDNDSLHLRIDVASSVSATRICAYMEQALTSLAHALQHTPQQPVRTLTVIPPEERYLLLHTFNQTTVIYPTDRCLHQLFEDQVRNNGHKIAVQCERESLSYAELNAKANQLAHYLVQIGVKPDKRVAVCVARGTALVVGMLGILKSGGAYVPLDMAYKSERLTKILQDSDPLCVLTDSAGRKVLGSHEIPVMDIDHLSLKKLCIENLDTAKLGITSNHLAYVIYTSGSTGTPKGVMIEHRTVVNFAYALPDLFDIDSNSRVLQFSSCSFDNSIKELIMGLTTGARLFIPSEEIRTNDIALLDYISSNKITHSCMTPALFRSTKDLKKLENMQILVFCGEAPTLSLLRNAAQHTTIFNGYGPTEATIATTYWLYSKDFEGQSIPVGRPVANFRTYILNSQGEPVPLGAEGELYISGAGVARGYLNRPDLTAERFLSDPFCELPGMRMYRSGDRARYLPDGNLVYLGRADQQVKIRGYRIEPGEIEACLANHPKVREAVVQPRSDGSDTRLIAYVVAADKLLARDIRSYLVPLLPAYMIPAAFVTLPAFPVTPNGKLDLRALPAPDNTAFASQLYEAPHGELEEILASIWGDLLGIERISRHDNFFELGGHSLLVMQFLNRLSLRDMHVDPQRVFAFPILMDFAREIAHNINKSYYDAAITVRRTGSRMPIFVLPDGHGDIAYGFELSHELDNRYPIYALPWPALLKKQLISMEELANALFPLIQKVQPDGPCAIVGYSAGGLLAYEIVKQLLSCKYPVAFLGLLDSYLPSEEIKRTKTDILLGSLAQKYPIFKTLTSSWWERVGKLSLHEAVEEIRSLDSDIKDADLERQVKLTIEQYHYQNMCAAYKIQQIPFKIHLFKADTWNVPCTGIEYSDNQSKRFWEKNGKSFYDHPCMGWEKLGHATDLQIILTKGDHYSIMKDPQNRTLLAKSIEKSIHSCEMSNLELIVRN